MKTMLFNPYSGKPRDPRDIASDPEGILVIDPDEPLMAAQPAAQEPAAFMYQHDETGQIGFVDVQQVEWGFWKNNPRLREIGPLYLAQPAAQEAPEAAWQPIATAPTDATRIMLAVFRPDLRADPSDFYLLATWDGEASHPFVPNNWTHWMRLPANPNAAQPAAQEPVTAIDEAFYFAVADKRGMVAECFDFVDYCPEKGKVPEHWEMKYTVRTMLEVQEHRYRNALAAISLTERDTTTAAADKIREAARIARKALEGKP